jgi:hypothetical protein
MLLFSCRYYHRVNIYRIAFDECGAIHVPASLAQNAWQQIHRRHRILR